MSVNENSNSSPKAFTSEATTRGIRICVRAAYSPEHSDPAHQLWRFLYTVTIYNESTHPVKLISRHWIITDAADHVEEVKGLGVVGQQPAIGPGESFEYTSNCPLRTPFGTMHGTYQIVTSGGEPFDATIAPFMLSGPYTLH
jgi:ApaG protein